MPGLDVTSGLYTAGITNVTYVQSTKRVIEKMAHCACKRKKLHIVPVIEKMAHCACKRKKGHIFTLTMDLRDTSLGKVY